MTRKSMIMVGAIVGLCAIVMGPVAIRQAMPAPQRHFAQIQLAELDYTEVSFRNASQDVDLAGMLFVPSGEGPFPGVVIIHGSGTSRRNNNYYLTLVSHLQRNGIVVLLPDKRGSEKSEGAWGTSSLEDLATDTIAAVDYLRSQETVAVSHVGIIGESQGGWIAAVVAAEEPDLDFVINMVGAGVTAYEQLAYEENLNLRIMGVLPGISNVLSRASTFVLQNVTMKGWWQAIGDFDPLPYWRTVNMPVLVLYGSEDTNVPSAESKARLESLGKTNIQVNVYAGSGHGLEDPPGTGDAPIRAEAVSDMLDFIASTTR